MNRRRLVVAFAALALGAIAGGVAYTYLSSVQRRAFQGAELTSVYVAAETIPRGTTGAAAEAAGLIKRTEIPSEFRPVSAIESVGLIGGDVAVADIAPNQVLVAGQFALNNATGGPAAQQIPHGDVAISVSVDTVHGVAGLISPGDRVDLLVQLAATQKEVTLYQDVPVLAVGSVVASSNGAVTTGGSASTGVITFALPLDAAERIALVESGTGTVGSLYLARTAGSFAERSGWDRELVAHPGDSGPQLRASDMALLVEDELAVRESIVVAIVEPLPETRVRLESSLEGYAIGRYTSIDELEAAGSLSPPVVVVLGPSGSAGDVGRLGALCRARPGVGGVLVTDSVDQSLLRASLRAGLADAIVLDEVAGELNPAVSGLAERLLGELDRRSGRAAPQRRSSPGRVTAVFSPKGGVGKSAIAVNLATVLARDGETVVLVDLDLQFGDIAVMLRLQPQHTIAEIASADDVDEDLVRSLLVEHEPSGVWVLAAPTEPSMAEHIDARAVARLLEVLRGLGRRIIVDTPPILSDVILQLLVGADDIAFVVGMDVPSVKNARIGLHALRVVGIPSERVVIVLNRADSKVNLAVRDVERAIERKIDVRIPSDVIVTQSINKGTPAALDYERSHFARSLAAMGETLSARELEEAASR